MDTINRYLSETQKVLGEMSKRSIATLVSMLYETWKQHRQTFILGNGGSASTASHMANDLSKATIVPGKPRMRVIALSDNISLITAWANDASYEDVFKEQLENLLERGDLVIGISASGNSPNVLRAMEFARRHGAMTVAWTGLSGGKLKELVDHCVHAPTDDVGMIESIHLVLDHLVTGEVRERIMSDNTVLHWASAAPQQDETISWPRLSSSRQTPIIENRAGGNGNRTADKALKAAAGRKTTKF
jgi:D-sedoheptulose 7-phosphate isomerase